MQDFLKANFKSPVRLAGLLTALAAIAIGGWYLTSRMADRTSATDMSVPDPASTKRGKEIFDTICSACHKGQASRAPTRSILGIIPPSSIVRALSTGSMKSVGQSLSPADHIAVAEYITGRKYSAAAESLPAQCSGRFAEFDYQRPPAMQGWGFDLSNTRNVDGAVSGITSANVAKLKLKWSFKHPSAIKARSQPVVAAGAIFVGSDNGSVYALDEETGCLRWSFQAKAEVRTAIVLDSWKAGDRAAKPLIYFGDLMGNLYGIRASDGSLVWSIHADDHPYSTITGSPALFGGVLFVPVSSLEEEKTTDDCCTFRGSIIALDAPTGKKIWQSFLVDEPKLVGKYPNGARHFGPSGVAVWNTPAVDPKRGTIYFATGDNYSLPATGMSDAVVAMDMKTGKIRWVNQVTKNDAWIVSCLPPAGPTCLAPDAPDFDFGATTILATTADGRQFVIAGQKSGEVYAMDPDTGEIEWRNRLGRGGVNAGIYFGMSVNARNVYVPIADLPEELDYPLPKNPGLFALDLKTGAMRWKQVLSDEVCKGKPEGCEPSIFSAPTISGDLIATTGADGLVRINLAQNGKLLWQYDTMTPVRTVSGAIGRGGSLGVGPVFSNGKMIINSGYSYGRINGDLLLVFEIQK